MAPLIGHTLGQRQKYYNELVKHAIENIPDELPKINFEEDDVDNMIRIDIACINRNIDYILDVLKCEDMLYVSRAINQSSWLINEPQYANIINPTYLHKKLFPQMNAKAVSKLLLHIRRFLKDEVRVKAFYNYVTQTKPSAALHWLQNCSMRFIETIMRKQTYEIPLKLLVRLCKKSINIFRLYVENRYHHSISHDFCLYKNVIFFLKSNTEEFLDITDSCSYFQLLEFNENYTHLLMKKCPQKIMDNFLTYYDRIDLKTFVEFLKIDDIKPFLIKYSYNKNCMTFETLKPFLVKLPREGMLDFLRSLFKIDDKENIVDSDDSSESKITLDQAVTSGDKKQSDTEALFYAIEGRDYNVFSNIYRWYEFAPFDLAFQDIKKFIFVESLPEERHLMLVVLLTCASYNFEHVKTVLQYYHDKHINELYSHKITFVNSLLSQHDTFRFDDSTWNTLNAIFHSLEVYIESGNKLQKCLISIILYNVLRDRPIHEIVEEKFEFDTLKDLKKKLNHQEQDKLFNYLYKLTVKKVLHQNTNSETGMHEAIKLLKRVWNLLIDWNKEESHHQFVIDKIDEFGNINKASTWIKEIQKYRRKRRKSKPRRDYYKPKHHRGPSEPYINLPSIYNMVKSYRKELFENSLILNASEEVCLNALKHDPTLLMRYKSEIDTLRCDDEVSLKRFLSKLRIYWPDSLATEWSDKNIENLQNFTGHRALVRGILLLLPHKKVLGFIQLYAPNENKIHWTEANEIEVSLQKHIAKNMHITRPQLPAEVALWYAKGDYLQYALLSLNTIYYNLRSNDIRKYINILLKAPVSLQKHGIRLAFAKLKTCELINQSPIMWKSTKNSSIRAVLVTSVFNLLCKQKKPALVKVIWEILKTFIDDLGHEENKIIYHTLGKVCEIPQSVIGEYYQKAYLFLKSLPPKVDLNHTLDRVIDYATKFIDYLDCNFVENILLGPVYGYISNKDNRYLEILTVYLLSSKDLTIQMRKYNNLLHPVIDKCVSKWANDEEQSIKHGLQLLLKYICNNIPKYVFDKKTVMPVELLDIIRSGFVKGLLRLREDYIILTRWKLTVDYVKLYDAITKDSETMSYTWDYTRREATEKFAEKCVQYLIEDVERLFPSIYVLYKDALTDLFNDFSIDSMDLLGVLGNMLYYSDNPVVYLLVIEMMPSYGWSYEYDSKMDELRTQIYFHPSEEVAMHYFRRFSEKYEKPNHNPLSGLSQSSVESGSSSEDEEVSTDENIDPDTNNEVTQDSKEKGRVTFYGYTCRLM